MMFVPALLSSLLVVISFHWDTSKLSLFRTALHEIVRFRDRTQVDVVVVTNEPQALSRALRAFRYEDIEVHAFNASSPAFTGDKYDLLWEHRRVVAERFHSPAHNYTSFVYLEDDTLIPWPNLVSWAIDTELLAPLGFTRGVYRTEINKAGNVSLNDMVTDLANFLGCAMNITQDSANPSPHSVQTLDVARHSEESRIALERLRQRLRHAQCQPAEHTASFHRRLSALSPSPSPSLSLHAHRGSPASRTAPRERERVPCPVHELFVQMYSPFQGMWAFSRSQLEKIMKDPLWDRASSMRKDTRRRGQRNWNWGSPERSNSILYFVDPPPGFLTSNVVPFRFLDEERRLPRLSSYGSVEHIRNGYNVICTVKEALVV